MARNRVIRIAHISDFHAGSPYFIPNLMTQTVEELNELCPDAVVVTGDLTDEGLKQEFKTAHSYLSMLGCPRVLCVPGNHDARNVGYVHFEELFGRRDSAMKFGRIALVGTDSSEPDLDSGRIGRERYRWFEEKFADPEEFKILAIHHHLLPVPGTGRERNIVYDAGDVLEVLLQCGVDVVLCGHKHVPYVWRLENLVVVNAGTAASMRLRGRTKPCYDVIEVDGGRVRVIRRYPFGGRELVADFSLEDRKYCKWEPVHSEIMAGGELP